MRATFLRTFNWLLYFGFCSMIATGLLLAFRLPPGSRGGRGLAVLGWGRHDWGDLHLWLAYGVIALVIAHLVLNWAWVKRVAAFGRLWPALFALIAGLALIVTFFTLPVTRGQGDDEEDHGPRRGQGFRNQLR